MAKNFSGKQVIKVLSQKFGFYFVSQEGSHVKLVKVLAGRKITTIVPLHKELALGTLRGVLDLAGVSLKDFLGKT